MPETVEAPDVSFALTATPIELPEGDERPCAYCNPTHLVKEREYSARQNRPMNERNTPLPDDAGLVKADFMFRFGHEDGAGVEVPVCDMCMDGAPVEHGDSTVDSKLEYQYGGDGKVVKPFVEEMDDGTPIHRRIPVDTE